MLYMEESPFGYDIPDPNEKIKILKTLNTGDTLTGLKTNNTIYKVVLKQGQYASIGLYNEKDNTGIYEYFTPTELANKFDNAVSIKITRKNGGKIRRNSSSKNSKSEPH